MTNKHPIASSWTRVDPPAEGVDAFMIINESRSLYVASSIDVADEEGRRYFHVSVSKAVRVGPVQAFVETEYHLVRPTDGDLEYVRSGFDMADAFEDSSQGKIARHLWKLVQDEEEVA